MSTRASGYLPVEIWSLIIGSMQSKWSSLLKPVSHNLCAAVREQESAVSVIRLTHAQVLTIIPQYRNLRALETSELDGSLWNLLCAYAPKLRHLGVTCQISPLESALLFHENLTEFTLRNMLMLTTSWPFECAPMLTTVRITDASDTPFSTCQAVLAKVSRLVLKQVCLDNNAWADFFASSSALAARLITLEIHCQQFSNPVNPDQFWTVNNNLAVLFRFLTQCNRLSELCLHVPSLCESHWQGYSTWSLAEAMERFQIRLMSRSATGRPLTIIRSTLFGENLTLAFAQPRKIYYDSQKEEPLRVPGKELSTLWVHMSSSDEGHDLSDALCGVGPHTLTVTGTSTASRQRLILEMEATTWLHWQVKLEPSDMAKADVNEWVKEQMQAADNLCYRFSKIETLILPHLEVYEDTFGLARRFKSYMLDSLVQYNCRLGLRDLVLGFDVNDATHPRICDLSLLAKLKSLQRLRLDRFHLVCDDMVHLLGSMPHLETLELYQCRIDTLSYFASALVHVHTLMLDLEGVFLGPEFFERLIGNFHLKKLKTLIVVESHTNGLFKRGPALLRRLGVDVLLI